MIIPVFIPSSPPPEPCRNCKCETCNCGCHPTGPPLAWWEVFGKIILTLVLVFGSAWIFHQYDTRWNPDWYNDWFTFPLAMVGLVTAVATGITLWTIRWR